jgi:hypothetical protein
MNKTIPTLTILVLASALPLAVTAQTTVFSDNFGNGSTLNGASTPGGTPPASSTSYDIASTKAATTGPVIGSGDLRLTLNGATTSGFVEAQAVFSSTPITLATVGDYINLTYTFTDTSGTLLAGTSAGASYLWTGLFNSGGSAPLAGSLNNSGLSTTAGSAFATGGAAGWVGYSANINGANGSVAGAKLYTRPAQTGVGTSSANQELLGSAVGGGAYNNPSGTQLTGGSASATAALTSGAQYTISYLISRSAIGSLYVSESLYSGASTNGSLLISVTGTDSTGLATSFDGLAIGARHSGGSGNPIMDINQITIFDSIQSVPEPGTLALLGGGATLVLFMGRRHQKK